MEFSQWIKARKTGMFKKEVNLLLTLTLLKSWQCMVLYCLMMVSRVLDVRTTAWIIKLLKTQGKATEKV